MSAFNPLPARQNSSGCSMSVATLRSNPIAGPAAAPRWLQSFAPPYRQIVPSRQQRPLAPYASTAAAASSGAAATAAADPAAAPTPLMPAPPRRVCILVEPSPFTYVCGYMNRYRNTIRFLQEAGCQVLVVTPGTGVALPGADASAFVDQPAEFHGARVLQAFAFSCPWYGPLPLSMGLSPRIYREIKAFNPDVIHCSSPGIMWFAALLYSRLLTKPLVYSYHTHVPEYMPRYKLTWLVKAMWAVIRFFHTAAHMTLVTSSVMATELAANDAAPAGTIAIWKKGVCSDTFHPQFRSDAMRRRLSGGHPEAPLLLSVGRLGAEKNLDFLKGVLERVPSARLAFVGDGPAREELKALFAGTNTVFMGMLHGEELSAAYASADIFVMPSESETLGFVVLEAMASGVPVVAVRAGGIPDILTKQGHTGFLYDAGDVGAAAALVQQLADEPALRQRVGAAARSEVGLWDWRAATQHLHAVQYPLAMAAAAAFYGKALARAAATTAEPGSGAAVAAVPAMA